MHLPLPLSLAFVLAAIACLGCTEAINSTGMISKRIGEEVHQKKASEVDLAKLTTFGWDRFFVFKAGTTREDVCKFIGANRNVCGRIVRIERAPEDHMFLLFALGGQLTHVELHAVTNGEFDVPSLAEGHPKSHAVFRVQRSSSSNTVDRIVLEPR
jgi:hypothetical protein